MSEAPTNPGVNSEARLLLIEDANRARRFVSDLDAVETLPPCPTLAGYTPTPVVYGALEGSVETVTPKPPPSERAPKRTGAPSQFYANGAPAKILKAFAVGAEVTPNAAQNALDCSYAVAVNALHRLEKAGRMKRVRHGVYEVLAP